MGVVIPCGVRVMILLAGRQKKIGEDVKKYIKKKCDHSIGIKHLGPLNAICSAIDQLTHSIWDIFGHSLKVIFNNQLITKNIY